MFSTTTSHWTRLGCCLGSSEPSKGGSLESQSPFVLKGTTPLFRFRVHYMSCKCQRSILLNPFKTYRVLFDDLKNIIKVFFEKALQKLWA